MAAQKMLIAMTQRVVEVPRRGERRDALDQAWTRFLAQCGCEPLAVPNAISDPVAFVRRHGARGIVLTGGGNLSPQMGRIDGAAATVPVTQTDIAPERDAVETLLLRESITADWPVIGVCRGMQAINVFHGGSLAPLSGHAATSHALVQRNTPARLPDAGFDAHVNSFHDFGIAPAGLGQGLRVLAEADAWPEAFEHRQFRHLGIMWHPERNQPFSANDIMLFRGYLGVPAN